MRMRGSLKGLVVGLLLLSSLSWARLDEPHQVQELAYGEVAYLYLKGDYFAALTRAQMALERGEAVATPPALWIQGQPDAVHDYVDTGTGQQLTEPERFAANYRKAGGAIEVLYVEQDARSSTAVFQSLANFFVKNLA